jgi:hypothetical protein
VPRGELSRGTRGRRRTTNGRRSRSVRPTTVAGEGELIGPVVPDPFELVHAGVEQPDPLGGGPGPPAGVQDGEGGGAVVDEADVEVLVVDREPQLHAAAGVRVGQGVGAVHPGGAEPELVASAGVDTRRCLGCRPVRRARDRTPRRPPRRRRATDHARMELRWRGSPVPAARPAATSPTGVGRFVVHRESPPSRRGRAPPAVGRVSARCTTSTTVPPRVCAPASFVPGRRISSSEVAPTGDQDLGWWPRCALNRRATSWSGPRRRKEERP